MGDGILLKLAYPDRMTFADDVLSTLYCYDQYNDLAPQSNPF